MEKALLIKTNEEGAPIVVKVLDYDTKSDNLAFFYKHIECDTIDIVKAYALADDPELENVCLVVDDEGLFKENATVNILASLLYGVLEHHQPLVGNVLVCKDVYTPEGIETGGLTDREVILIQNALDKLVSVREYNEEVMRRKQNRK